MTDLESEPAIEALRSAASDESRPPRTRLAALTALIELANTLKDWNATETATRIASRMDPKQLRHSDRPRLFYNVAVAWGDLYEARHRGREEAWLWRQEELEHQLIYLRRMLNEPAFPRSARSFRAPALTNLGNVLHTIGRPIEALRAYDGALEAIPSFGMAALNKAIAIGSYASLHYDRGQAEVLERQEKRFLETAFFGKGRFSSEVFERLHNRFAYLRSTYDVPRRYPEARRWSLGRTSRERAYRAWALERRLFLNPMNDLGPLTVAARDTLSAPNIVVKLGEGPTYHGFLNQLKQEYIGARWMLYSGTHAIAPDYVDRDTTMVDTMDYPQYGINAESIRNAFRVAYSLLDKIAVFCNDYFGLAIPERRVNIKTIWYEDRDPQKGLRRELRSMPNLPLRGLYWLARDLFDRDEQWLQALEPEAEDLADVRHHLEHKYLKLHSWMHGGSSDIAQPFQDRMAHSVSLEAFVRKTERMVGIARAALMYLVLAVESEERTRRKQQGDSVIGPMPLMPLLHP